MYSRYAKHHDLKPARGCAFAVYFGLQAYLAARGWVGYVMEALYQVL